MQKTIVLGGGCFWCVEAVFKRVKGVKSAVSGYAGGSFDNPTYEQLHQLETGHAEVVEITYDNSVISLEKLLEIFWHIHDPTTPNRQGGDTGPEYRSIILYGDDNDLEIIKGSIEKTAKQLWDNPIVTEVKPLDKFFKAEEYHQDYFNKNPENSYCQIVINPKLKKFEDAFGDWLE